MGWEKIGKYLNGDLWDFEIVSGSVEKIEENTPVELIKLATEPTKDWVFGFDPKVGDYAPIKPVDSVRLFAYFKLQNGAIIKYKLMPEEIQNFKDYNVKAVFIYRYIDRIIDIKTVNVKRDVISQGHWKDIAKELTKHGIITIVEDPSTNTGERDEYYPPNVVYFVKF